MATSLWVFVHVELVSLVQVPCERCEKVPFQPRWVFSEGTWARKTHWDGNLREQTNVIVTIMVSIFKWPVVNWVHFCKTWGLKEESCFSTNKSWLKQSATLLYRLPAEIGFQESLQPKHGPVFGYNVFVPCLIVHTTVCQCNNTEISRVGHFLSCMSKLLVGIGIKLCTLCCQSLTSSGGKSHI